MILVAKCSIVEVTLYSLSEAFSVIVGLYGTIIHYDESKISRLRGCFNHLKKIFFVIFASPIFLVEEIQTVFLFFKECRQIQLLSEEQNVFKHLSLDKKDQVKKFYNAKIQELDKVQKLICREATIQVALQLTLILYQEIFIQSFLKKQVRRL